MHFLKITVAINNTIQTLIPGSSVAHAIQHSRLDDHSNPFQTHICESSAFNVFIFHISFCNLVPLSLQNAMKALYKNVTKIRSIGGNIWGSSPKCPYFMMQFIEQPLFPKCFQGQELFMCRCGWSPVQCSNHCLWDEYRILSDRGQPGSLNHKQMFGHISPCTN